MTHVPYGYRIENGRARINEEEAERVLALYFSFLSGKTMKEAAEIAGIRKTHSMFPRLLKDKHYIGDDYYPRIIEPDMFQKVQLAREKRKRKRSVRAVPRAKIHQAFAWDEIEEQFENPYEQAEYMYSKIRSIDGKEYYCNSGQAFKKPANKNRRNTQNTSCSLLQSKYR
jgi:hypothetical protein